MKHFLIIFAAVLALTACQSDETDESSDYILPARRTVIVYMSAENNLTSYAQNDINEMIKGRKSVGADCDLIIFVDRASQTEKPFIARIRNRDEQPVDTYINILSTSTPLTPNASKKCCNVSSP